MWKLRPSLTLSANSTYLLDYNFQQLFLHSFQLRSVKHIFYTYLCMFVIVSFRCSLKSYFLLVVLLVMSMSRKSSECLSLSDSPEYFNGGSCFFSMSKPYLHETSFENVMAVIYKASEPLWDNFVTQGFHYFLTFYFLQITFWQHYHKWKSDKSTVLKQEKIFI